MRKKLFLTTAIVAVSFATNNVWAENITQRQVVDTGDERSFSQATADGIESPFLSGGVIKNAGTVNIDTSEFKNNSAGYGGAVYNSGILNIDASDFKDNHASSSAGAIYNSSKGTVNITGNTTFENNTHSPNAGEVILNDIFNVGTLNLNPSQNEKIYFGGGIDGDGGNDHGTMNINGQGEVWVKNELIYHDVNLQSGTLLLTPSTSAQASRFVIDENAKFSANNTEFKDSHAEGKNGGAISRIFMSKDNAGDEFVSISSSSFTNNTAKNGGAISNKRIGAEGETSYEYVPTVIANAVFSENEAEYKGGAIYNEGTMDIENSEFVGNKTGDVQAYGGAIYNGSNGLLTVTNSDFIDNMAGSSGGAIHNRGTLIISGNTSFTGNIHAPNAGGYIANDIYNTGSMHILPDENETVSFEGGIDGEGGQGLIGIYGHGKSIISNELAYQNVRILRGTLELTPNTKVKASHIDVIDIFEGTPVLNATNVLFTGQQISDGENGGVIYNDAEAHLVDSEFAGNSIQSTQSSYGGVIQNYGYADISGSRFSANKIETIEDPQSEEAVENKGGVIANYGMININNSVFSDNEIVAAESTNYGGVINNKRGIATIADTEFINNKMTGNWSQNYGGVINNDNSDVTISNSTFKGNSVEGSSYGSAIYNIKSDVTISNSSFIENSVLGQSNPSGFGGAIYNQEGIITITDSVFDANSASGVAVSSGGAIYIDGKIDEEKKPLAIVNISDSTFRNNASSWGGAIDNKGQLNLTNVSFNQNKAEFEDPDFGGVGGAVRNYFLTTINGGSFTNNSAFDGGAIYNENEATIQSTFEYNTADRGGAIYNLGHMLVSDSVFVANRSTDSTGGAIYNTGKATISDSEFNNNKVATEGYSTDYAGAFYNRGGTVTISNTSFTNNQVVRLDKDEENIDTGTKYGGAISNRNRAVMTISGATFSGNKTISYPTAIAMGGAIHNDDATLTITNSVFADNETIGGVASSGGAIFNDGTNYGRGRLTISNSTFTNNKSVCGGAIENSAHLTLENVSFVGNTVNHDGDPSYARGGALWNFADATITDSSFINNSAVSNGGAIYNSFGEISFNGQTVFEGNTSGGKLNDIYNGSKINVAGNLSLDGGLTGYSAMSPGKVTFADGSNLNVKAGTTTIVNNSVKNEGATLEVMVGNGFSGEYELISSGSTLDNEFTLSDNNLYNIAYTDTKGTYAISKKSSAETAEAIGVSVSDAAVISAITNGEGSNVVFNDISNSINNLIQSGDAQNVKVAVKAAETLAPDAAPIIEQMETTTTKQVFGAVSTRLSGGSFEGSQGISSGDTLEDVTVWMQGLANHAKLEKTSKYNGFKADTYGAAFGLEKKIDVYLKAGVGYAYSSTDIDAKGRDTDVKTHTLLTYGEYKPSNWFINGIASFSWSDYKESKSVLGNRIHAKYDVKTLAMQVMSGYDFATSYMTITPEGGLRYMHINGERYSDSAGQQIHFDSSNIVTGVIGSKITHTIEVKSGLRLTPEARLALTYDLKRAKNLSNVMLPNGSSYDIKGQNLDRFEVELGAGLTAEINDNVEMSIGYEGGFRKHYQNHSGLLNVKYKF